MYDFDVMVIGAGPAGYEVASLLGTGGKSVCIIEKGETTVGGTCLNEGCVPAKNFLETSAYIKKEAYFRSCGVNHTASTLDMMTLQASTHCLIQDLKIGLLNKLKKSKVTIEYDTATFIDNHAIKLEDQNRHITAKDIVIASGSSHRDHPLLKLQDETIISSREVFKLKDIPKSILIIGGGAIGCEFASFFNALGSSVHISEFASRLVANEDDDVSRALKREFEKKDITIDLNANVTNYHVNENGVEVTVDKGKKVETQTFEKVLISIGRIPNTSALQLEQVNIEQDRGYIEVNDNLQCLNHNNIYAIGDVLKTPALAHVAYYEAKRVAQHILGKETFSGDYIFPWVTFCTPQIASIGKSEKVLKENGIKFKNKKLFFKTNAKAKIKGDDSGFIKVLYDEETSLILGASIIGNDATELIHQFLIAINANLGLNDLEKMIFAHPTLSESSLDLIG
ncbi:MAG: dihydrolipoyl dehydrogenase [Sulfurovum sp.]|uniref:dihydrolipoyl dehydrogenase n=1 Tax=Sulfurovum sp. TaxID=1969726 RepID=UPI003C70D5E6